MKNIKGGLVLGILAAALMWPRAVSAQEINFEGMTLTSLMEKDDAVDVAELEVLEETAEALGVKLESEYMDGESYKIKIRIMLQGNEMPDLFYTWGGSYSQPFIDAGVMAPLEDALKASGYELEELYKTTSEDGHMYAMPLNTVDTYVVFYNKQVFEELGCSVPTTYEELLHVTELCREQEIYAMGLAQKDRWEGDLFYNMLVLGEDRNAFANSLESGDFTGEAYVAAAEKLKELLEKEAFYPNYMEASTKECVELLKVGRIAMYPGGSWHIMAFQDDPDIGCAVFPSTGKENAALACGAQAIDIGVGCSVSDHTEEAAAFAVEFSKRLNDRRVEQGYLPYFVCEEETQKRELTRLQQEYLDIFNEFEMLQTWWFSVWDADIGEPYRDLVQSFYAGNLPVEYFIEQMQEICGNGKPGEQES